MNTELCPNCNAEIPDHAPGKLCPSCVLRGADESLPRGQSAPSLEAIAAAFPELEILSFIGQGGMGSVYQVRQPELDRTAALKILSPALSDDPAFAERFAREARVMGKLKHPNIVTIFESGECGGYFYLLMEYVDGVNLRQAMQAGRFTPEQALAVVPGICDALQAAHAEGVWHRDIKPENILLDKAGDIKIVDFGIARLVGDPQRNFTLTMAGQALGSSAYMAPEQHEKPHEVDHRADIYSLGVVIYELLTGELPLGRFPSPGERSEVDARIDEIVLKTLEKERAHRHQSAGEVKTDFETASVTKAKSPVKAEGVSFFDDPQKAFVTSLGLWLGGIAAVEISGNIAPPTPTLFGLGCLATLFGFIGCGGIMLRIRKKKHPVKDRLPLLGLFFWPCTCAAVLAVLQLWIVATDVSWHIGPEGELWNPTLAAAMPLVFVVLGIIFPLVLAGILWRVFARGEGEVTFKWWPVVASCFVVVAMMAIDHFGEERLAVYRSCYTSISQFGGQPTWEKDRVLIEEAMAEVAVSIPMKARLFAPGDPELPRRNKGYQSGWLHLDWRSPNPAEAYDAQKKYISNLRALLPNRLQGNVVTNVDRADIALSSFRAMRMGGFITGFAVVFLLTSGRWIGIAVVGGFSLVVGGVLMTTSWPGLPEGLPPLVSNVDAIPMIAEKEYDYSTTRDAITSHVKAAQKGDQAVFEVALSTRLMDLVSKSGGDVSSVMKEWKGLSYGGQMEGDDEKMQVKLKGESRGEIFTAYLVKWNGNWQIDSLFPVPMNQEPEIAARGIVNAANAGDRLRFLNGFSSQSVESFSEEKPLVTAMSYFSKLSNFHVKMVHGKAWLLYSHSAYSQPAPNGFLMRTMEMESGEWKFVHPPEPVVDAVLYILGAAKSGEEGRFREQMTQGLIKETDDIRGLMRKLSGLRLVKLVHWDDASAVTIVLEAVDKSWGRWEFVMVEEDGSWKLRGEKDE